MSSPSRGHLIHRCLHPTHRWTGDPFGAIVLSSIPWLGRVPVDTTDARGSGMGKYDRWNAFFAGMESDEVVLTLEELEEADRKSTRLNSSHVKSAYAVFC